MDLVPLDKIEKRRFSLRHIIVTGNVTELVIGRTRNVPKRFAVVCDDVERAIELAKQHNPGMKVVAVSDQGAIDKVDSQ